MMTAERSPSSSKGYAAERVSASIRERTAEALNMRRALKYVARWTV
jgi:hypothetical protein